ANPMKLLSRMKRIQEEIPSLKVQCRELIIVKQDLIDKARTTLLGNRTMLLRMQAGISHLVMQMILDMLTSTRLIVMELESDLISCVLILQIIDEWTTQVRLRGGDEKDEANSEDINKLLFSATVQSN
ncbi:Ska2, N-terminal, partial [Dillenia turbinata]